MSKKHKAHFPKQCKTHQHVTDNVEARGNGWVRCKLTAELLSDAHFGSGSGGGGIDALIARNRKDRPVIWASHIEGVLRDAARRLRGEADAGTLFGRAGGDRQRIVFTSLYANEPTESHIWRSTAREAFDNRAPKDDTLRVVEYVPKGTKLVGEVEVPKDDLPLLGRLVQEVDALGGGRSTGAGRVKLVLSEVVARPRKTGSPRGRLVLLLKNRDPLCITATATPDNLIPSLAFVPGRSLLGAVAAWLIDEGDRATASLLTSGRISVSDALPLPQVPSNIAAVEVIPAPLSLQSEKPQGSAGEVPWWAQSEAEKRRLDVWTVQEKLTRPEDDLFVFRTAQGDPWTVFRPARRVRLRNGRPEPTQPDASLFAIEQIVEETHFLADLRGSLEDMKNLAQKLTPVLEGRRWLRVGRAGAPVEVVQLAWSDAEVSAHTTGKALLTLTSDLLVRDAQLRWRTALEETGLRMLLENDELNVVRTDTGAPKTMQDSVMIYGFNGTSRLWRMPAAAIRRGSVYEVSGDLVHLEQRIALGQWLGERTHEGFGRFRLDTVLPGVTDEARAKDDPVRTADADEEAVAAKTYEWWRAHQGLSKAGGGSERKPSLSQWNDLVNDLARGDRLAITARLTTTTAGARTWQAKEAEAILRKLEALPPAERSLHARIFVRWLRSAMRKGA